MLPPKDAPYHPSAPSGHTNAYVAAIVACFQQWAEWLDSGEYIHKAPSPFNCTLCDTTWTEEQLDRIITKTDKALNREIKTYPGLHVQAEAGMDFHRLAMPQRLALVQQLHAIKHQFPDGLNAYAPSPSPSAPRPEEEPLYYDPYWEMG